MLLICEAILIVLGAYMLLSGRIDIGGVRASGPNVRLAGAVLMAPLAFGALAAPLFVMISGGRITADLLLVASCVELLVVLGALSVASQLVRQARSESEDADAPAAPLFFGRAPSPPAPQNAPAIMTVAEAAAYLRVSEQDVRDLIEAGKLPAARVGGEYRIARRAVDDYVGGDDDALNPGSSA
ncbi:MAG: helix-turn-helix domain-containing protein [Aggregatilineales bacterium]